MGLVFESGEIFSGGIAMVIVGFIFIFFDLFDTLRTGRVPKKTVSILPVESLIFSPESPLETKPSTTLLAYLFGVTKAGGKLWLLRYYWKGGRTRMSFGT